MKLASAVFSFLPLLALITIMFQAAQPTSSAVNSTGSCPHSPPLLTPLKVPITTCPTTISVKSTTTVKGTTSSTSTASSTSTSSSTSISTSTSTSTTTTIIPTCTPATPPLYASVWQGSNVSVFNDCNLIANVPIPGAPYGIAYDNSSNTVYVAYNKGFATINLTYNATQLYSATSTNTTGYQIGYNPSRNYLYMTDESNSIYAIQSGTRHQFQRFYLPGSVPTYVGYDPNTTYTFVVDQGDHNITYFTINPTVSVNVSIGKDPYFAVAANGDVYVSHAALARCAYVDTNVSLLVGTQFIRNISIGQTGGMMAYDPKDHFLYIADQCTSGGFISDNVSVVNTISQSLITTISGIAATSMAYDPHNDDMYIGDSTISGILVMNATTMHVAGTVSLLLNGTSYGISQILYNPHDNYMYVGYAPTCYRGCADNVTLINGVNIVRNITIGGVGPVNITQSPLKKQNGAIYAAPK